MSDFPALNADDLQQIQGGFPWTVVVSVLTIVHKEAPDFVLGWKDYHRGRFAPRP